MTSAAMPTSAAIEVPQSTHATIGLLRELQRGRVRKQATTLAYWLYLAGLAVFIYGGWLVSAIVRALRHPHVPPASASAVLGAAPAGLCALALLVLVALLWDARWRGPVTVSQPTADWLLDTPVRRERLLRPRYRLAMLTRVAAGAVAGLVPATLLLATGVGGHGVSHSLRLAGIAMLGTALLVGLGSGVAGLAEAHPGWLSHRLTIPVATLAAATLGGLATLAALVPVPAVVSTVLLWSGPWGWAAQGVAALSGGSAPLWPVALALLAVTAVAAIAAGDRLAASVPASALRARARTIGSMSAAVVNGDTRRVATAYRSMTGGYGRVRFRLRPPLRKVLVLPWRDLVAVGRAPARLVWATVLALAAVGLGALAVHAPQSALLPLAGALGFGYLAAASLCEGARMDADDTRRSGQLPFRYDSLAWWHAIVPCGLLAVLAGLPAAALALATGNAWVLVIVAVAIVVLTGGALVHAYRGPLAAEVLGQGFETPFGSTGGITVVFWYLTGPILSVAPLIWLSYHAISDQTRSAITSTVVVSLILAGWLGVLAARRARRLRAS